MALEKNQNDSAAVEYNNIANSDSAALLPHLESFEKMMKLPVVGAAWHQGQDVYGRVKGKLINRNNNKQIAKNWRKADNFHVIEVEFVMIERFQTHRQLTSGDKIGTDKKENDIRQMCTN